MNIVAQKYLVTMSLRLSWGCNCDEVLCEVYWHLPVSALITSITKANASLMDPEYFLVRSACDSIGEMYGVSSQPVVQE